MSMGLCMRQTIRQEMRLEMRLEQKLELAQTMTLKMEQLTKEELEELGRQGLLGSGIMNPLRIRRRAHNGTEIVMKKYEGQYRDAYREAGNMKKLGQLGFGVPKVQGVIESGQNGYLITEFEKEAMNLRAILHNPVIIGTGDEAVGNIAGLVYKVGSEIAALHKAGVNIQDHRLSNILIAPNPDKDSIEESSRFIHTGLSDVVFENGAMKKTACDSSIQNLLSSFALGKFERYGKFLLKLFLAGYKGTKMPSMERFIADIRKDGIFEPQTEEEKREVEGCEYYGNQRNRIIQVERNIRKSILEAELFNATKVFEAASGEFKASLDHNRGSRLSSEERNMYKALMYAVEGLGSKFSITYKDVAYRVLLPNGFVADDDDDYLKAKLKAAHNAADPFAEATYRFAFAMGVPNIDSFRYVFIDSVVERACMEIPNWNLKTLKAHLKDCGFDMGMETVKDALERLKGRNSFITLSKSTRETLFKYFNGLINDENQSLDFQYVLSLLDGTERKEAAKTFLRKLVTGHLEKEMVKAAHDKTEPDFDALEMRFGVDGDVIREMYRDKGGIFAEVSSSVERVLDEDKDVVEEEEVAAEEKVAAEGEISEQEIVSETEVENEVEQHNVPIENERMTLKQSLFKRIGEDVRIPDSTLAEELGIDEVEVKALVIEIMHERHLEDRRMEVVNIIKGEFDITGDQLVQRTGLPIEDINLILRFEVNGGRIFVGSVNRTEADDITKKTILKNLLTKRADLSNRELSENLGTDTENVEEWLNQLHTEMGIDDEVYHRVRSVIENNPGIEDEGIQRITGLTPIQIHLALRTDLISGMLGMGSPDR